MKIQGVDNVLFNVGELEAAIAHYSKLGLTLKFKMEARGIALFKVGEEAPGLMLRSTGEPLRIGEHAAKVWLEVPDARAVATEIQAAGLTLAAPPFQAGTGWTVEVKDPWGNV